MLPKNLQYQNKIGSASCRSYTACIQPQNGTGTYSNGQTITINIPTSPNTVLVPSESYLKFDLGGLTPSAINCAYIRLDKAGAHGVFQRVRTLHGSQELENFDQYYVMAGELMALQQSTDSINSKLNILAGMSMSNPQNPTTLEIYPTCCGDRLNAWGSDQTNGTAAPTRTFCINLISMVGSLGGNNYIPLFEMTSAPLSLNLQLVNSALKFVNSAVALGATNSFTITNCEFVGSFIELSDSSINVIRESLMGEPLQYVIQSYANYGNSASLVTATPATISHPVSAKFASLRSLFAIMRSNEQGVVGAFSQGSNKFGLSEWRVRIGSQLLPYKAPSTTAEHFSELIKAIGSLSDVNHEPTINMNNYSFDTPLNNNESNSQIGSRTKSDCFALGFDCEAYSGASKDSIFAGMNTLNSDIFFNMNFSGITLKDLTGTNLANGTSLNIRFDYFALYDNVLICENGVMRSIR